MSALDMNMNKFNILFLYSGVIDPLRGGIESVTNELAEYFTTKGCSCYYLSLNKNISSNKRQYYLPNSTCFYNVENKEYLINFIKQKQINILINQGGFDKDCSQLAYLVKAYGVKLISCIHNSLLDRIRNFDVSYYNKFKKKKLHFLLKYTRYKFVKNILYLMYYFKYQKHFKKLHAYSDSIILLSDSFRKDFSFFVGDLSDKISAIANPIPAKIYESESNDKKEKILLYVGRIDMQQKRSDLLLQIWSMIYKEYNDWKLCIVGGGKDLNYLKTYASTHHLENVIFEGNQNPIPYYQKASIFCMTSSYEGFGIVLVEAMNMKLVPIAFESFSTVRDIIDDNVNGILIPPFDRDLYAKKISEMIKNDDLRYSLSNKAYQKSQKFRMDVIGDKWLTLFASFYDDTIAS